LAAFAFWLCRFSGGDTLFRGFKLNAASDLCVRLATATFGAFLRCVGWGITRTYTSNNNENAKSEDTWPPMFALANRLVRVPQALSRFACVSLPIHMLPTEKKQKHRW
jgi:hypothetical protein